MPKQLFSYCLSDKNTTKQETVIQAQCPNTMESNANNAASLVLFFMFTFMFFPKASRKQTKKKTLFGFCYNRYDSKMFSPLCPFQTY